MNMSECRKQNELFTSDKYQPIDLNGVMDLIDFHMGDYRTNFSNSSKTFYKNRMKKPHRTVKNSGMSRSEKFSAHRKILKKQLSDYALNRLTDILDFIQRLYYY